MGDHKLVFSLAEGSMYLPCTCHVCWLQQSSQHRFGSKFEKLVRPSTIQPMDVPWLPHRFKVRIYEVQNRSLVCWADLRTIERLFFPSTFIYRGFPIAPFWLLEQKGSQKLPSLWGNPSVHVLVGCRDQKKAKSIFRSERAKVGQLFLQRGDSLVQHMVTWSAT